MSYKLLDEAHELQVQDLCTINSMYLPFSLSFSLTISHFPFYFPATFVFFFNNTTNNNNMEVVMMVMMIKKEDVSKIYL